MFTTSTLVLSIIITAAVSFLIFACGTIYVLLKISKNSAGDPLLEVKKIDIEEELDAETQKCLLRLEAITDQQFHIIGQLNLPSKNAMHSKHKNGLISIFKGNQEEQIFIMESLLKRGKDMRIPVTDSNGGVTYLKISEILGYLKQSIHSPLPQAPTKRDGKTKLTLIKNEEPNNGDHIQ